MPARVIPFLIVSVCLLNAGCSRATVAAQAGTTTAVERGRYLVDAVTAASVDIVSTASRKWKEQRHAGSVPNVHPDALRAGGHILLLTKWGCRETFPRAS